MFLPEKTSETCTVTTECQSRFPRSFSKWFWLLQNIFEKFLENRVHFFKKCHDFLKKIRDFEKKVNSPDIFNAEYVDKLFKFVIVELPVKEFIIFNNVVDVALICC